MKIAIWFLRGLFYSVRATMICNIFVAVVAIAQYRLWLSWERLQEAIVVLRDFSILFTSLTFAMYLGYTVWCSIAENKYRLEKIKEPLEAKELWLFFRDVCFSVGLPMLFFVACEGLLTPIGIRAAHQNERAVEDAIIMLLCFGSLASGAFCGDMANRANSEK